MAYHVFADMALLGTKRTPKLSSHPDARVYSFHVGCTSTVDKNYICHLGSQCQGYFQVFDPRKSTIEATSKPTDTIAPAEECPVKDDDKK